MYSYETLISILKLDNITDDIKAAAVRLLMCLYIDRDPQCEIKIPVLTQVWSDIAKSVNPSLPFVEPTRRYVFGLLQQLVSDHIAQMANRRWIDLSFHMLKLLHKLIKFNFYGTTERLLDVIHPLIRALDRRQVTVPRVRDSVKESASAEKKVEDTSSGTSALPDSKGKTYEVKEETKEEMKDDTFDLTNNMTDLEGDEKGSSTKPWQEVVLEFMESIMVMLMVLVLVLAAVVVTLYQMFTDAPDTVGSPIFIWGIIVLIIFILEVGSRMYCHTWVRGSLVTFITNPFNVIDVLVIGIDILFLCLPTNTNSSGKMAKIARLVRMVRLVRILKAAKVISALSNLEPVVFKWVLPERYTKVQENELKCLVEGINILLYAQKLVDARNLSALLRGFYEWESGEQSTLTPSQIFENVMVSCKKELTLSSDNFDLIFLDNLMFIHPPLVQASIDLLMANHSMRCSLFENASNMQLIVSQRRERQFKLVDQMLSQLERNAETHELWGELQSDDDRAINKQTIVILKELAEICRVRKEVLEFDLEYEPDVEIQNLYRNLGCFSICFKVLGLFDSLEDPEEGEEEDEVSANTRTLCLLCNDLMYWFLLSNKANQELGYSELNFFLESLTKDINSHNVIRALFHSNERLMKLVPHSIIHELVESIINDGRNYVYLSLLASITYVGEKNIVENQSQIMHSLGTPSHLPETGLYFVSMDHKDYRERKALMAPLLGKKNVKLDDLPQKLAYHLMFVEVMAACTVGRLNITSIEAKVQSIYNYADVISCILDEGTILFAKIRLGRFLFNAVVEVEMMIPGLEHTDCIWKLLISFIPFLEVGRQELLTLMEKGWECEELDRNVLEYTLIIIKITGSFFARYFDVDTFRTDDNAGIAGKVQMKPPEIERYIRQLYAAILTIYQLDCPRLTLEDRNMIYETLGALNRSVKKGIVSLISSIKILSSKNEIVETGVNKDDLVSKEAKVLGRYKEFLQSISDDAELMSRNKSESSSFISVLESLPYVKDAVVSDLRYEAIIRKLVGHVYHNLSVVNNEKQIKTECLKTSIWIIKSFRTMIENRMGMSIYERDEGGGEEQDEAAWPVVNALNECGATALCLDLIAVGIDDDLQAEAIRLLVGMLFKEGGAIEVQTSIHNHLSTNNSVFFFKQVTNIIQKLIGIHSWNGVVVTTNGEEPIINPSFLVIRMLQLMCEGHYLPNQNIMCEQARNEQSYNLLNEFVNFLNCLTRLPCRTSTVASLGVAATILEVIQGPCVINQQHFAINTELLECLNRLLRSKVVHDCVEEEEIDLKKIAIDILEGLLEGQGIKSAIYDRLLSVVHLDIIQYLSGTIEDDEIVTAAKKTEDDDDDDEDVAPVVKSEEVISLETECIVLLQMLCNYQPSLRSQLGLSDDLAEIAKTGTASVEVIWHGVLQRRFFHIPELCHDIAKTSKDKLIVEIDRSSVENRLNDFIQRSHELYREVKHIQVLRDYRLITVFNAANLDKLTWLSFCLACIINTLLLCFFHNDHAEPTLSDEIIPVIFGISVVQIVIAGIVLIMYSVVRMPVVFKTYQSQGNSFRDCVTYTLLDGMFLYYSGYFVFTVLGIVVSNYVFTPVLLLDIVVKNSTTRDVLYSIYIPRKQLSLTLLFCAFTTYTYAFYIFLFFPSDLIFTGDCNTLWNCMKAVTRYGLSSAGGAGDIMIHTLGSRYLLDLTFFLVVLIVVLNLIFGIIINAFSSLREESKARMANITETCFICGIDNQTFDRASTGHSLTHSLTHSLIHSFTHSHSRRRIQDAY